MACLHRVDCRSLNSAERRGAVDALFIPSRLPPSPKSPSLNRVTAFDVVTLKHHVLQKGIDAVYDIITATILNEQNKCRKIVRNVGARCLWYIKTRLVDCRPTMITLVNTDNFSELQSADDSMFTLGRLLPLAASCGGLSPSKCTIIAKYAKCNKIWDRTELTSKIRDIGNSAAKAIVHRPVRRGLHAALVWWRGQRWHTCRARAWHASFLSAEF